MVLSEIEMQENAVRMSHHRKVPLQAKELGVDTVPRISKTENGHDILVTPDKEKTTFPKTTIVKQS